MSQNEQIIRNYNKSVTKKNIWLTTMFFFVTVFFILLLSSGAKAEGVTTFSYTTFNGGVQYTDLASAVTAAESSITSGLYTEEAIIINIETYNGTDAIIELPSTIVISKNITIVSTTLFSGTMVEIKHAEGLSGPLFRINDNASLTFSDDISYAPPFTALTSTILDGNNTNKVLIDNNGTLAFGNGFEYKNSKQVFSGTGIYETTNESLVFYRTESGKCYTSFQMAIDNASSGVTIYASVSPNGSGDYMGQERHIQLDESIVIKEGQNITLHGNLNNMWDNYLYLEASASFSGMALFFIEEGATFKIENDTNVQFYFDLGNNAANNLFTDNGTVLLFDASGDINIGYVWFIGSAAVGIVRASGSFTDTGLSTTGSGTFTEYYEILFDTGFEEFSKASVIAKTGYVISGLQTYIKTNYLMNGWISDYDESLVEGGIYTVATHSDTLISDWNIVGSPTVVWNGGNISSVYDGTNHVLSVTASHSLGGQFSLTYDWSKDGQTFLTSTSSSITVSDVADSGAYSCVVTITDGKFFSNSAELETLNVIIQVAQITKPTAATTTFTYTGSVITLGIAANSTYTITGNTGTNVNSYTATVSLNDTANYEWDDSTITALTVSWSITKAQITKPTAATTTLTYTGSVITLGIAANSAYTITGYTGTNVNSYTATVSLNDTANYEWDDSTITALTVSWSIIKAKIIKPMVLTTTFTYTGSVITLGIAANSAYTISNNTGINADAYTADVALNDKANYEWADGTVADLSFAWVITKKQIAKPTVTTTTFTYTGAPITLDIAANSAYTISGNVKTAVGTYSASVALNNVVNYEWADSTVADLVFGWSIIGVQIMKPTVTTTTFTYTGSVITLGIAENSVYTITGNTGTNVNTYTATVVLKDKVNCNWDDGTVTDLVFSWSITKLQIAIPTVTTNTYTYTGSPITLDITANSACTITGNVETVVGDYSANVTLNDVVNCEWSDGTVEDLEFGWSIIKAHITKPTVTTTTFTYTGSQITLDIAANNAYAITGNTGTNANTYTATVALGDTANYEWDDSTTQNISFEWKINRVTVNVPSASDHTFNGEEISAVLPESAHYILTGNKAVFAGDYTATATLADTQNYVFGNGETSVSLPWAIKKKAVTVKADNLSSVYGEELLPLTYSENGFVSGYLPIVVIAKADGIQAGVYPINLLIIGDASINYDITVVYGVYTINKAEYDMSGIRFEDKSFDFDGNAHSLEISGTLPQGVNVSYVGNGMTTVGSYTVTAVFTGDTVNYEPIESMNAYLIIISGNEEFIQTVMNLINTIQGIDSSWLSEQAKVLYKALTDEYINRATAANNTTELDTVKNEFYAALDNFAVDVNFENVTSSSKQYYDGDTVDSDFFVRISFFDGDTALVLNSYIIKYDSGDCLHIGDEHFAVIVRGLTLDVNIPAVLPDIPENISFIIDNTADKYVYGDTLGKINGKAFVDGKELSGTFAWTEETLSEGLTSGKNICTFSFKNSDNGEVYKSSCEILVEKATPVIKSVKVDEAELKYGDDMPAISGEASCAGVFSFDEGQMLKAGTMIYTYKFTPDDTNFNTVSGDISLTVSKAVLSIKAEAVIVYEGSTPVFPICYTGFVNGDGADDLIVRASIKDIPSKVGNYTVIPSGALSANYEIVYIESPFTVIGNHYKAVIETNNDEGTSVFDIGDGNKMTVTNLTSEITEDLNRNFSLFTADVYSLHKNERLVCLYGIVIEDGNGTKVTGSKIIQLRVPDDYKTGYALHIINCTDDGFGFISDFTVADGIITFIAGENGRFAISAVKEADVCSELSSLVASAGENPDAKTVNTIKALYDCISVEARNSLLDKDIPEKVRQILATGIGKVDIKAKLDGISGIYISGVENVLTPEISDGNVGSVQYFIDSVSVSVLTIKTDATEKKIVTAFDFSLCKTIYRDVDGKPVPYIQDVNGDNINGFITLYIPLSGDMLSYEGYEIWYVRGDALSEKMNSYITEIDGQKYLALETPHFSRFALVGNEVSVFNDKRAQAAWQLIFALIIVVVVAVIAVKVICYVISRKRKPM